MRGRLLARLEYTFENYKPGGFPRYGGGVLSYEDE